MNQSLSKGMILASVILMDLLTGMEFDLFVPAFPQIQDHFGLTPSWVEALLSVNFIGYCISLFFVGDLADRFGRKPIILLGLIIFVLGSVLCRWAPAYEYLLIGRLLQGIGIAAPAILSFLIIADNYPLREQHFWMAMLNGTMNIAVGISPVIGSYITLYFHWHGNFSALLILGLIVLLMTIQFIPSYDLNKKHESILLQGMEGYKTIFNSKPLILLMINIIITMVPYWIFVGMSPLLYIKDLGVSLTHFGYYQGILALVYAIGTLLYGMYIKHNAYNTKDMLKITNIIYILSLIFMGIITLLNTKNPLIITLAILLFCIGQIIPGVLLYTLCINYIPQAKGRISALLQGGRLILAALGLQIVGYFYDGTFLNIGLILLGFVLVTIITLYFIIKNEEIMNHESHH